MTDKVARLVGIGAIEPPRPNRRIVLDPRFARIEINRAIQQQLQYQRQAPSRPIYTTRLGTVVRTFGDDDNTVGTVETDDSMSSANNLPSIDVHLPYDMKSTMGEYKFADLIVYKEQLGNALARCQHSTRDCGHSPLVDTLVRHRERTGDITVIAMPPLAQRPTNGGGMKWSKKCICMSNIGTMKQSKQRSKDFRLLSRNRRTDMMRSRSITQFVNC
jgi:hypothetical protein